MNETKNVKGCLGADTHKGIQIYDAMSVNYALSVNHIVKSQLSNA